MISSEETLRGLQTEAHQMKSSIKKHDNLVEKYKKKVQSSDTDHYYFVNARFIPLDGAQSYISEENVHEHLWEISQNDIELKHKD